MEIVGKNQVFSLEFSSNLIFMPFHFAKPKGFKYTFDNTDP